MTKHNNFQKRFWNLQMVEDMSENASLVQQARDRLHADADTDYSEADDQDDENEED